MKHLIEFVLIAIITLPFAILPRPVALRAGRLLGVTLYYLVPSRKRITHYNIAIAQERGFVDASIPTNKLVKECFRNIGRIIAEVTRVCHGLDRDVLKNVRMKGAEHIEAAIKEGRGYICVTGHFGNWEMAALASSSILKLSSIIVRKQKNSYMDKVIVRNRKTAGNTVVYQEGALKQFIRDLKAGGGVGLVMDEPVRPDKGTPVSFLGYRAGFQRTLHLLSKKFDVPVLPFVYRSNLVGGDEIIMYPPLKMTGDETEDTQQVADFIQRQIAERPTHWLQWFRKWKWTAHGQETSVEDSAT